MHQFGQSFVLIRKPIKKWGGGGRWNKRTTRKKGEKTLPSNFKFFFICFFTLNFWNKKMKKKVNFFLFVFIFDRNEVGELMNYSRVVVHIVKTKGASSYFLFFPPTPLPDLEPSAQHADQCGWERDPHPAERTLEGRRADANLRTHWLVQEDKQQK
jgi:hypothetical protein